MIVHDGFWERGPRLGREGRRWRYRKLYLAAQNWLKAHTKVDPEDPETEPLVERMVSHLEATPGGLLSWSDEPTYRGPGYASGAWRFREDEAARRLPEAFNAAAAAEDQSDFPDLDSWLDAERRGTLYAAAPLEVQGADLLGRHSKAAGQFFEARNRVRAHWPRRCRACDAEFRPERNGMVRCAACRAGNKSAGPRQRREEA